MLLLRVSQYRCQCCQDGWDDGAEEPRLCASSVTLLRSPGPAWSTQTVTSSWIHLSPWSFSDSSSDNTEQLVLFVLLTRNERENLMSLVLLFILIEVELIYKVMLVSGVQKNDSCPKGRNVE